MLVKNNNRLKELRVNRGYTLDDIESKTGIKRGTYSNYENHNTEPKLETWQKLAKFYGVSVSYLQGNTFSKIDIYKVVCNEYITPIHDPFFEYIIEWHLHIMEIKDLKELFSINELRKFTKNVQNFFETNFQFVFLTELGKKCLTIEKSREKDVLSEICVNFSEAIRKVDEKLLSTPISEAFDKEVGDKLARFNKDKDQHNMLREADKKYIIRVIQDLAVALYGFSEKISDLPENSEITSNKARKRLKKFVDSGGKSFE